MGYITYFDYAAVLLGAVLLIFCYPKMSIPKIVNRLFKCLVIMELAAVILDLLTVIQYKSPFGYPLWVLYLTNILYLSVWNAVPLVLTVYTLSFVITKEKITVKTWAAASVPYLILFVITVSSPATHAIFYFSPEREYLSGSMHIFAYVTSGIYMIATCTISVACHRIMGRRKMMAIVSFTVMMLVAMGIQIANGSILLMHFFAMCATLIMYLALQSPEENVDRETGLYNREAFLTVVSDSVSHERPFAIINVVPDNIKSISNVYGIGIANLLIKALGDFIGSTFTTSAYLVEGSTVAFIYNGDLQLENITDRIKERFTQNWTVGNVEIHRTCSISVISYPEVAKDTEGLLDAVTYSVNELKKNNNSAVVFVKEQPRSAAKLDELEKQKLLLEEESREANLAKERAEKADREKSMFLANMSHEIRTPMNAIMGMTELILSDEINERVRQNATDIKGAGESLLQIINDILDISKVESGKMEVVSDEYDVRKLITEFVNLVSTRINMDKVDFKIDVDPTVPEKLYGDELRVCQIFINILNNAAKFTSEGSVSVSISGKEQQGKYIMHAEIADTGCGIRPEDMDKLFSAFERIEDSHNRYIEGTGLGLPLCRKLLKIMDGDIHVESEYGKGSRFIFDLPQGMTSKRTLRDSMIGRKDNVLIILDELERAKTYEVRELCKALDDLECNYRVCSNENDVEEAFAGVKLTHVFTYADIYAEYEDRLKDEGNPLVMLFYDSKIRLDDWPDVRVMKKPIYYLSVLRQLEYVEHKKSFAGLNFKAAGAKVLVVDDNLVNIKVIEGMLKRYDITVDSALSGEDALEKVEAREYHIIFMDHMMPGMDGVEATRRIRSMGGSKENVPIVALTANAVQGVKNMFMSAGFTEYLSKPVSMNRVCDCLIKLLPSDIVNFDVDDASENGEAEANAEKSVSIPEIEGIDTARGMRNNGNEEHSYMKQLAVFVDNGPIQLDQISKLYAGKNMGALKVELRLLKNIAYSIGASKLENEAKMLEVAAEKSSVSEEDIKAFEEDYSKLIETVNGYLVGNAPEYVKKPEYKEGYSAALSDVEEKLNSFDDEEALRLIKVLINKTSSDELRSELKTLSEEVEQFMYKDAMKRLSALIGSGIE